MKKGEKYSWIVNNRPPDLDPHSKVKHQILRGYLSLYFNIIFANINTRNLTLTIVDGFAGGGEYIDSTDNSIVNGSPLIALETVRQTHSDISSGRTAPINIDVEYHFVEALRPHTEYLRDLLNRRGYGSEIGNSIFVHDGKFSDYYDGLVQRIEARSSKTKRAIFILDQYSYKDVPFSLIRDILGRLPEAEFIITFNYHQLTAYLTDSVQCRKILDDLGLANHVSLDRINALKEAGNFQAAIQEQLSAGIKESTQAGYMTLYFLNPLQGWSYWLVHLSNSFRANEAMRELHWQTGNSFSHSLRPGLFQLGYQAKRDADAKKQLSLEFAPEFNFDDIARDLCIKTIGDDLIRELFSGGPAQFKMLRQRLAMSPATREIIASALGIYIRGKELQVKTVNGGGRRGGNNLHDEDLIIPVQRSFILLP